MRSAEVLLVTGPAGSGKTTVAALIARAAKRAVHIETDWFFEAMAKGDLMLDRSEPHARHRAIASSLAGPAVREALDGQFVVIDGILSGALFLEPMREEFRAAGVQVWCAMLASDAGISIRWARARRDSPFSSGRLIEDLQIGFRHRDRYLVNHVIDNTMLTAEETSDLILQRLACGELVLDAGSATRGS